MQTTLNSEVFEENTSEIKALMNLQKFYSAFVALFLGYFLAILVLIIERLHWKYKIKKHPFYNIYSRTIVYPKNFQGNRNFINKHYSNKTFEIKSFYKKFKGLKLIKN